MVLEQEKVRPLPWYRRDLGWWPGIVGAFVMLDCGMALTHPVRTPRDVLVSELAVVGESGGDVRRHTARECEEVARIVREWWGMDLGQSSEWTGPNAHASWVWQDNACHLTVTLHRPASSAG